MLWYQSLLLVLATILGMEAFSWFVHKYLLHGPLWFMHRSHHVPNKGWFEKNDWVAVSYAILSAALVIYGMEFQSWTLWVGIGIAVYGVLYFGFHDVIIHRRIKIRYNAKNAYIKRLIRAHKIHHKHLEKEDGEAFGFLYATKKYEVKELAKK